MMSRGSSLPSPRGMMRGAVSGLPLMGRGSPAKAGPAWGARNSRQMYGRPGFLRGYAAIGVSSSQNGIRSTSHLQCRKSNNDNRCYTHGFITTKH